MLTKLTYSLCLYKSEVLQSEEQTLSDIQLSVHCKFHRYTIAIYLSKYFLSMGKTVHHKTLLSVLNQIRPGGHQKKSNAKWFKYTLDYRFLDFDKYNI